MKKVAFVFGTRPEAIKMAPLINSLASDSNYQPIVILTGQHPTMAREVLTWFSIKPTYDFAVNRSLNTLNGLAVQLVSNTSIGLGDSQPDLVVVQGDTASAFLGAFVAFNMQIAVAHLEAGLRTNDIDAPFPEEAYRQMISRISSLNMCPTQSNKINLLGEGVSEESIMVTGNTVVDAFSVVQSKLATREIGINLPKGIPLDDVCLVTTHRRENLERGMTEIASAVLDLSITFPQLNFVIPLHPNPEVRNKIVPMLESKSNVHLVEPLGYPEFITLLGKSKFVLTDSGGVQEEAPILGIPALVLRDNTERPEGIDTGGVILVGADKTEIIRAVSELMTNEQLLNSMSKAANPYGDGLSSKRCHSLINEFFGFGNRESEFIND